MDDGSLSGEGFVPSGSGTQSDPYSVKTPEAFAWWALLHSDASAKLEADVDLTASAHGDASWPGDSKLSGTLDGQGHAVLFRTEGAGLFAEVAQGGRVEWLQLGRTDAQKAEAAAAGEQDARATRVAASGALAGGALAGSVAGTNRGAVQGVVNRMDVEAAAGADAPAEAFAGGIVAVNDGTVQNCANLGAVSNGRFSGASAAAGIAAAGAGAAKACYNAGSVDAAGKAAYLAAPGASAEEYAARVDGASCYLAPGQGASYAGAFDERDGALPQAELEAAAERLNGARAGADAVWRDGSATDGPTRAFPEPSESANMKAGLPPASNMITGTVETELPGKPEGDQSADAGDGSDVEAPEAPEQPAKPAKTVLFWTVPASANYAYAPFLVDALDGGMELAVKDASPLSSLTAEEAAAKLLPSQIEVALKDHEAAESATETLDVAWASHDYDPKTVARKGAVFEAELPEGYALSVTAKRLRVAVVPAPSPVKTIESWRAPSEDEDPDYPYGYLLNDAEANPDAKGARTLPIANGAALAGMDLQTAVETFLPKELYVKVAAAESASEGEEAPAAEGEPVETAGASGSADPESDGEVAVPVTWSSLDFNRLAFSTKGATFTAAPSQDGYELGEGVSLSVTVEPGEAAPLATYANWAAVGAATSTPTLSGGYYQIGNAAQLAWFAYKVNNGSPSISAKLTADIDLTGTGYGGSSSSPLEWDPIGNRKTTSTNFSGTFDGAGYTVSGLYINDTSTAYQRAFFGFLSAGASVKDLNLQGSVTGYDYVGMMVGCIDTSATVSRVTTSGSVTGTRGDSGAYTGGIAGRVNGVLEDSVNRAKVSSPSNAPVDVRTGGIVGHIENSGTVQRCANYGDVSSNQNAGGIAGYMYNLGGTPSIADCYNAGTITGSTAGGIIGSQSGGSITSCYSYGTVSTSKGSTATRGAIAGNAIGGSMSYCYYDSTVDSAVGRLVGTASKVSPSSSTSYTTSYMRSSSFARTLRSYGSSYWHLSPSVTTNGGYPVLRASGSYSNWGDVGAAILEGSLSGAPSGSGTSSSPYLIGTPEALAWLAAKVNKDGATNVYARLTTSINLLGSSYGGTSSEPLEWVPIGDADKNPFIGSFDGYNYTVSNLRIDYVGTDFFKGLFGIVGMASTSADTVVTRLNLQGSVAAWDYMGMAFGAIRAARIDHVTTSGTVTGRRANGGAYTGGVAGRIDGTLEDSVNRASVSSPSNASQDVRTGGITGHMENSGIVRRCANYGTVSSNQHAGGITGYAYKTPKIVDRYNAGSVTGATAGGIAGRLDSGSISNSYSYGSISSSKGSNATRGGVVGTASGGTITNCYYNSSVNTSSYVGGIVGTGSSVSPSSSSAKTTSQMQAYEFAYLLDGSTAVGDPFKRTLSTTWTVDYSSSNRYWTTATSQTNSGYPVFGTLYDRTWMGVGAKNGTASLPSGATGTGSSLSSPLKISSPEALGWFSWMVCLERNLPGGVAAKSACITLTADINLSGSGYGYGTGTPLAWIPIAGMQNSAQSAPVVYEGAFDGSSHTVSYLRVANESLHFAGLIGYASRAEIRNVTVSGSVTRSSGSGVSTGYALLAGNASTCTVKGCTTEGTVSSAVTNTGGVVGRAGGLVVEDCTNKAAVTSTMSVVGGIAGSISGDFTVSRCANKGAVKGYYSVGGIVGSTYASSSTGQYEVNDSYNTGRVEATGNASTGAGGIVGAVDRASVNRSYNAGDIFSGNGKAPSRDPGTAI